MASKVSSQPTFALGDVLGAGASSVNTEVRLCKTGNAPGTFVVSIGTGPQGQPSNGGGSVLTPVTVNNGTCRIVAISTGDANANLGDYFGITENAADNTTQTRVSCVQNGVAQDCAAVNNKYFTNTAHGWVITYNNNFSPPPTGCTFTKGYWRNKGNPDVNITDVGRTTAQVKIIFQATPGKPLGVSWGDDNLLLNAYQQYLAALQNLGANPNAGPPALDLVMAFAALHLNGAGLVLTTDLDHDTLSTLTDALTFFNEGNLTGWPHCDE
jgi:hypothetical protein